jgi:hypothetical protein
MPNGHLNQSSIFNSASSVVSVSLLPSPPPPFLRSPVSCHRIVLSFYALPYFRTAFPILSASVAPLSRLCRASACTIIISSLLKDLGVGRAQTYYDGRPHYYFLRGMSIMSRPLSKSIHTVERVTCNLYTLTSVYSTLPAYNYGVT